MRLFLKRFEQSNRIHKKIFDHISFPEILDMSPFMSTSSSSQHEQNSRNHTNGSTSNDEQNDDDTSSNEPSECKLGCGKFDSNK